MNVAYLMHKSIAATLIALLAHCIVALADKPPPTTLPEPLPAEFLAAAPDSLRVQALKLLPDNFTGSETTLLLPGAFDDETTIKQLVAKSDPGTAFRDSAQSDSASEVTLQLELEDDPVRSFVEEVEELDGVPLLRLKDDKKSCVYFGLGLDGTVGLRGIF